MYNLALGTKYFPPETLSLLGSQSSEEAVHRVDHSAAIFSEY